MAWRKENSYEPECQVKLHQHLRGLLRLAGNPVPERKKGAKPVRLSRKTEKAVYVMSGAWYSETIARLEGPTNWRAEAGRFALAFYSQTGLRVDSP